MLYKNTKNTYLPEIDSLKNIKISVINSITRRLDSDQPMAFLLSGGVDSSLVASIASKVMNKKIRTFCCGMNHGSDLKYAKMVADHIGSDHTEVIFSPEEGLQAINDVIYTTETWDTTTIRASVGQYLVSKYISQNTDAKVLFVGEGPDEVCSSYLFNYYAPDPEQIHSTAIEYVNKIHYFDVKRSDRCIARWGLEARVALLDPEFIEAYWKIPSKERHPLTKGIEKWWLRQAFEYDNLLPKEVLWRKKEAFSDGVSGTDKSWFQIIQEYIQEKYNMTEKEYYKHKFIEFFGEKRLNIIPHYWQPKWNKDGTVVSNYVDPSARTLDIYNN
jgi:asparagine synthase (glutamine-hydrolysing)